MFRFLIVKCCVAPEHKWNTRLNITLRHVTLKETSRRRNFRKIDVDVGLLNEPWRGFPLTKSSLKKSSIKDKIAGKVELKQTWMCLTNQLKERTATTAETTQYSSCISPGLNRVWSVPQRKINFERKPLTAALLITTINEPIIIPQELFRVVFFREVVKLAQLFLPTIGSY